LVNLVKHLMLFRTVQSLKQNKIGTIFTVRGILRKRNINMQLKLTFFISLLSLKLSILQAAKEHDIVLVLHYFRNAVYNV